MSGSWLVHYEKLSCWVEANKEVIICWGCVAEKSDRSERRLSIRWLSKKVSNPAINWINFCSSSTFVCNWWRSLWLSFKIKSIDFKFKPHSLLFGRQSAVSHLSPVSSASSSSLATGWRYFNLQNANDQDWSIINIQLVLNESFCVHHLIIFILLLLLKSFKLCSSSSSLVLDDC